MPRAMRHARMVLANPLSHTSRENVVALAGGRQRMCVAAARSAEDAVGGAAGPSQRGFSQTETWFALQLPKRSPRQPACRERSRSPARRAIRSSSDGHA